MIGSDMHTGLSGPCLGPSRLECYWCSFMGQIETVLGQVASGLRAPNGASISLHWLVLCPKTNSVYTLTQTDFRSLSLSLP